MRNLTIKRMKKAAGSLGKVMIYIADRTGDTLINDTLCRLLGTLKNGEEKTFSVSEEQVNLIATADKLSRNLFNEIYTLPAGSEDVLLIGRNSFNPAAGNMFRFDSNCSQEALDNRRRGLLRGWLLLACAVIIGILLGLWLFAPGKTGAKLTFNYENMRITLNDYFKKTSAKGFNVCYQSSDVAIFVLKETLEENLSLEEYGDRIIAQNDMDSSIELKQEDGLYYFEYGFTNTQNDKAFNYFASVYKNGGDYWLIQFACLKENYSSCRPSILDWAKSVEFD